MEDSGRDRDKVKDSNSDPRPFRHDRPYLPPVPDQAARQPVRRRPFTLGKLVLWLLAGAVLLATYSMLKDGARDDPGTTARLVSAPESAQPGCNGGGLPAEGGFQVIDASRMRRTDVLFSGLGIVNRHHYDVVAILSEPDGGRPLLGLAIPSGRTVEASVPVGHYGLHFFAGTTWCNDTVGFRDGRRVNMAGGLDIEAGSAAILTLAPDGPEGPERFSVAFDRRLPLPAPEKIGPGYVELRQHGDGHYRTEGTVNGKTLTFILDTGATLTSLSEDMAALVGLDTCTPADFHTANGTIRGCVAHASELAFGGFVLRDIEVAIIPKLASEALLGMNVLRRFRVEQQGDTLRITSR